MQLINVICFVVCAFKHVKYYKVCTLIMKGELFCFVAVHSLLWSQRISGIWAEAEVGN